MTNSEGISFEMVLKETASLPFVRVNRDSFLKTELAKYCPEHQVKKAIGSTPACAGIEPALIHTIAKSCISYETNKVSALSFAAGIPGGLAIFGTIPADLAQYFGHIFRVVQKLIYLYGWQELFDSENNMDDETANLLTLFVGVMFGVSGAAAAITKIAESMAMKTSKDLARKALTQGIIYPIVKKVAAVLGQKMTKDIFAKGVSKIIPIVGGVLSGGLTYITFRPMSCRLQEYLSQLKLVDPSYCDEEKIEDDKSMWPV